MRKLLCSKYIQEYIFIIDWFHSHTYRTNPTRMSNHNEATDEAATTLVQQPPAKRQRHQRLPHPPSSSNPLPPFSPTITPTIHTEPFLVLCTRRRKNQVSTLFLLTLAEPRTCADAPAPLECQCCGWYASKMLQAKQRGVTGPFELSAADQEEYQMICKCIGTTRTQYHHPIHSFHPLPEDALLTGIRGKQTTVCSVDAYLSAAQRARVLEWVTEQGYEMPARMICIQERYCRAIQEGKKTVETRTKRLVK